MSVRVLIGKWTDTIDAAVLYCSTTDWAFGPIITDSEDGESAEDRAYRFIAWLPLDARKYGDSDLERKWSEFASIKRAR